MRFQRLGIACLLLATAALVNCSQPSTASSPDPQMILQSIPAAAPAEYGKIRDMKTWRNPYLIVRSDGVALYDIADNAEIILKPNELLPALAKLPAANWPYGRVVATAETDKTSEQDGIAIRRNKGIIGGLLQGAHIDVRWVPTT